MTGAQPNWREERRIKRGPGDRVGEAVIYAVLLLLSAITILPFMQVITISVSPPQVVNKFGLHLIPLQFDWSGYLKVFSNRLIWSSYANTILRTLLGTSISVVLLVLGAYPLSKRHLPNRKLFTAIIVFTMYFQGGLIPLYILVKGLGMYNTVWALVLPPAVSAFSLIIMRNFFMAIPEEIEESAKIDGANDFQVLIRIVLPLSKSVLATVALWSVVYHWNEWFNCMVYIKDDSKFVLQYVLRLVLIQGMEMVPESTQASTVSSDSVKMATLIVATLPIVCVYPFLQKYFVKGVLIGSVKG